MRTILVLNPKGGCGKSTVAMNLAGCYASRGRRVALADCDPQRSAEDWLALRPPHAPRIEAASVRDDRVEAPRGTEIVVVDTPAGTHGRKLAGFVRASGTMIMPLLPSPLDMRSAERFVEELFELRRLINRKVKLATLANRAREDTLAAARLENYLGRLRLPGGGQLPFITVLRASQNYVRAAEEGLSIFEFAPARTTYDREQWQPLIRWLDSARSLPD